MEKRPLFSCSRGTCERVCGEGFCGGEEMVTLNSVSSEVKIRASPSRLGVAVQYKVAHASFTTISNLSGNLE